MDYKEKFGKSSDSVTHFMFFGFADLYTNGVQRYTRLACDGRRAVYLVLHAPTKKIKGMLLTTGENGYPCSAMDLLQVLVAEEQMQAKQCKQSKK